MAIRIFLFVFLCFLVHPFGHFCTYIDRLCCCGEVREVGGALLIASESVKSRPIGNFWLAFCFHQFCTSFYCTPLIRSRRCHCTNWNKPLRRVSTLPGILGSLDLSQRRAPRRRVIPAQFANARLSFALALALVSALPWHPLSPLLRRRPCERRRPP